MVGYVGDSAEQFVLALFADADLAGCQRTLRSTSGVFLCAQGPNTMFPISATSKKQTVVSHSTPEAELVAADVAMRQEDYR